MHHIRSFCITGGCSTRNACQSCYVTVLIDYDNPLQKWLRSNDRHRMQLLSALERRTLLRVLAIQTAAVGCAKIAVILYSTKKT